jgi:SAM-dependent methyltransferase
VVAADIRQLDPAAIGGPFDLAFSRLFLMHQSDPVNTLRAIARMIRPGGWIVVHEPLRCPPPRSHPPLDALGTYWDMLHVLLERAGVPGGTVENLPTTAHTAGLHVVSADGFFAIAEPKLGFEIHAATLAACTGAAVQHGIAAEIIDRLIGSLRAAKAGGYEWVSTPFFMDLALRKP